MTSGPAMTIRPYDPDRDRESCRRIWREVRWLGADRAELLDTFLAGSRSLVAEQDGAAECLVTAAPGTIRHLAEDLPMTAITGVTTSRVARRCGLASRTLARLLAEEAEAGTLVATLFVFDQGFYDRLGFGPGCYQPRVAFDPADLVAPRLSRAPRRLTADDAPAMHRALLARHRSHGACSLLSPGIVAAETGWSENGSGLGFSDGAELTHFLWCEEADGENGPLHVRYLAYRTGEDFLELLGVLHSLSDQIHLVTLDEPAEISLLDLLREPFRRRRVGEGGRYATGVSLMSGWQVRMLDPVGCLAVTQLPWGELDFNLELSDPLGRYLLDHNWRGCEGVYRVQLGAQSSATLGRERHWPTVRASVNAFTRLWLGIRPASGLAVTDDLEASPSLLKALDDIFRLPRPLPGWAY